MNIPIDAKRENRPMTLEGISIPTQKIIAVCDDCVDLYREGHQMFKLIEECNELAAICSKYINEGFVPLDDVKKEAADVQILLWQFQRYAGGITNEIAYKISRQDRRNELYKEKHKDESIHD